MVSSICNTIQYQCQYPPIQIPLHKETNTWRLDSMTDNTSPVFERFCLKLFLFQTVLPPCLQYLETCFCVPTRNKARI